MKGIMFSEPMVLAWMEGRKTVTRRLIKNYPAMGIQPCHFSKTGWAYNSDTLPNRCSCLPFRCPYLPGETVYIKETWCQPVMGDWKSKTESCHKYNVIEYAADMGIERFPVGGNFTPRREQFRWRSSRFMPEWAARSHARIVSVRPERVQEITREEALREGKPPEVMNCPTMWFQSLWESLHPGSWERNDRIWRIKLEKLP